MKIADGAVLPTGTLTSPRTSITAYCAWKPSWPIPEWWLVSQIWGKSCEHSGQVSPPHPGTAWRATTSPCCPPVQLGTREIIDGAELLGYIVGDSLLWTSSFVRPHPIAKFSHNLRDPIAHVSVYFLKDYRRQPWHGGFWSICEETLTSVNFSRNHEGWFSYVVKEWSLRQTRHHVLLGWRDSDTDGRRRYKLTLPPLARILTRAPVGVSSGTGTSSHTYKYTYECISVCSSSPIILFELQPRYHPLRYAEDSEAHTHRFKDSAVFAPCKHQGWYFFHSWSFWCLDDNCNEP